MPCHHLEEESFDLGIWLYMERSIRKGKKKHKRVTGETERERERERDSLACRFPPGSWVEMSREASAPQKVTCRPTDDLLTSQTAAKVPKDRIWQLLKNSIPACLAQRKER